MRDNTMTEPQQAPQFTDDIRPQWHGRVPQAKIRRLYELDAQGIPDEELIEDVAFRLLERCRSILVATQAHEGRATCPRCENIIPHSGDKNTLITCSACGWQTTWGAYFKTYQHKQLVGGSAMFSFRQYVEQVPLAKSARERWLLIDWLIHIFHCELSQHPTRPAANNLIEGKGPQVVVLLNNLTYSSDSAPETKQRFVEWQGKAMQANDLVRAYLQVSRLRQHDLHDGD
jgi:ribosomal protein L37AE/L43A